MPISPELKRGQNLCGVCGLSLDSGDHSQCQVEINDIWMEVEKAMISAPSEEEFKEYEINIDKKQEEFIKGNALDYYSGGEMPGTIDLSNFIIFEEISRKMGLSDDFIKSIIEHEKSHFQEGQKLGIPMKIRLNFFRSKENILRCAPSVYMELDNLPDNMSREDVFDAMKSISGSPEELSNGDKRMLKHFS